jgi:hypothetical protein
MTPENILENVRFNVTALGDFLDSTIFVSTHKLSTSTRIFLVIRWRQRGLDFNGK